MSKKVADIIVETLQSAGVRHCYGVVGDTLNLIARSLERSKIEWVSVRHEEAGAFAAQAEAQVTGHLTAVAGSCGPGSLHFINGIFEANRNRAPVVLIASQIIRDELGFDFIQEVDFKQVYQSCSVFCDMIYTAEQARRKTVIACQTALAKRVSPFSSCRQTFPPQPCTRTCPIRCTSRIPSFGQATLTLRRLRNSQQGRENRRVWRIGLPGGAQGDPGCRGKAEGSDRAYLAREGFPRA